MKRRVQLILVLLLTFITEVVLAGYKVSPAGTLEVISKDKSSNYSSGMNPGYMFDDYGQNVNLKVNTKK